MDLCLSLQVLSIDQYVYFYANTVMLLYRSEVQGVVLPLAILSLFSIVLAVLDFCVST